MPTYAYACKDCGHAFDVQQSFSDDALTVCPECGGVLRKQFGAVGVVFKGSGFYKTDSRESGKKTAPSSAATAKDSSSKDSASKDSSSKDATKSSGGDKAASAASGSSSSSSSSSGSSSSGGSAA
ncbi:FmdB family zinc ribbon protein [Flexivirga oryzae]|uniref:Putative FmdB family regulatory protein n=1 Tax=Flexivirga oryzae TaxID=1794944 RepID=A0A839N945_9MICO|nr:putative FmdB family regulatory protein [Flexivirga oryzae]